MKTLEQIKKIEAVVLYVLMKFKDGVDYIKLFKIIYFAQKEYLANYGAILCPDTFKARIYGPVPVLSDKVIKMSELQDCSITDYPDLQDFFNSIEVKDKVVFAKVAPNMEYLSRKECECLDKWFFYCKDKDSKQVLSEESHDEAYENAIARAKKNPQLSTLTNVEIAHAGGASEQMIAYIREKELLTSALA